MLEILKAKPKVGYFIGNRLNPLHHQVQTLRELKVKDICLSPVIVKETASVHDTVVTLFLEDTDNIFVIDAVGRLSGVVSRKDLLKFTIGNHSLETIPISMVMTRQPKIVSALPEDGVVVSAEKMLKQQVDSLPVVSEHQQGGFEVIGRIDKTIIMELFVQFARQSFSDEA